ncbi:hypothetical protein ACFL35_06090 [Candidatus Riflebacteria bacterium]
MQKKSQIYCRKNNKLFPPLCKCTNLSIYPYPDDYDSYYPKTKAMAEKMFLAANWKKGVYTTSIRPDLIWAPGDNHLIPRFLKKGKTGRKGRPIQTC